ncbi:MAG TPA: uroporphyrinogen-III synthase [Candidatus Binatia bacterium]
MAVKEFSTQRADNSVLSGKRIVVTRPRTQAGELSRRLSDLGAEVIEFPTIAVEPPFDYAPMDRAIAQLNQYDWLFFTSINGVQSFFDRLRHFGNDSQDLEHLKVVAIGPETARRLEAEGVHVDLVPSKYQAEGILECLDPAEVRGRQILIPRAAKAREILPETLRQWGAIVNVVHAYKTVLPQDSQFALRELSEKQIDLITFTSSSTVENFMGLLEGEDLKRISLGIIFACIGPITARTAMDCGLRVAIVSSEYTIRGLVGAIVKFYESPHSKNWTPSGS